MNTSLTNITDLDAIDTKLIIRAALTYYKLLDEHISGKKSLPPETIKFISDRLLEQVLILQDVADNIYEQLSPEEKNILALMEEKRNENKVGGSAYAYERGIELSEEVRKASDNHYDTLKDDAVERTNFNNSQMD